MRMSQKDDRDASVVSTRPFVWADFDACLAVFDSNVPDYFRDSERGEFEAFLRDLPGPYLVIEMASDVVGCGGYALRPDVGVADLCWGMIHRSLHGRGLGTVLAIRRLQLALKDEEVRAVELNTSQRTVGFYETLGFELLSVHRDGYSAGLDRCDMRLEVTQEAE